MENYCIVRDYKIIAIVYGKLLYSPGQYSFIHTILLMINKKIYVNSKYIY